MTNAATTSAVEAVVFGNLDGESGNLELLGGSSLWVLVQPSRLEVTMSEFGENRVFHASGGSGKSPAEVCARLVLRHVRKSAIVSGMTATTLAEELRQVPEPKRGEMIGAALRAIYPESGRTLAKLIRRLENPDIPEDVWRGIEDAEDGRVVDMETAMGETPPPSPR